MPLTKDDYSNEIDQEYLLQTEEEIKQAQELRSGAQQLIYLVNDPAPEHYSNSDWLTMLNNISDDPYNLPEGMDINSKEATVQLFKWTLKSLASLNPEQIRNTSYAEYHKNLGKNAALYVLAEIMPKITESLRSLDPALSESREAAEMNQICSGILQMGKAAGEDAKKYASPVSLIVNTGKLTPEALQKLKQLADSTQDPDLQQYCNDASAEQQVIPEQEYAQARGALENIRKIPQLNYIFPAADNSYASRKAASDAAMQQADEAYPAADDIPVFRSTAGQETPLAAYTQALKDASNVHLNYVRKALKDSSTYDYRKAAEEGWTKEQVLADQRAKNAFDPNAEFMFAAAMKDHENHAVIQQRANDILNAQIDAFNEKRLQQIIKDNEDPEHPIQPSVREKEQLQSQAEEYKQIQKDRAVKAVLNPEHPIPWVAALLNKPDLSQDLRDDIKRYAESKESIDLSKLADYYVKQMREFAEKYQPPITEEEYLQKCSDLHYYQGLAANFESFYAFKEHPSGLRNAGIVDAHFPGYYPQLKKIADWMQSAIGSPEGELDLLCSPLGRNIRPDYLKNPENQQKILNILNGCGEDSAVLKAWYDQYRNVLSQQKLLEQNKKENTALTEELAAYIRRHAEEYLSEGETDLPDGDWKMLPSEQYNKLNDEKYDVFYLDYAKAKNNMNMYFSLLKDCRNSDPVLDPEKIRKLTALNAEILKDTEEGLKRFKEAQGQVYDPDFDVRENTNLRLICLLKADAAILSHMNRTDLKWQDAVLKAKEAVQDTFTKEEKDELQIKDFEKNQKALKECAENRKNELIQKIADSQKRMKELDQEAWQNVSKLASSMDTIMNNDDLINSSEFRAMHNAIKELSEHRPESISDFLKQMQKLRNTARAYTNAKDQSLYSRTMLKGDQKQNRYKDSGKMRYHWAEIAERTADRFIKEIKKENREQKQDYDYLCLCNPEVRSFENTPSFTSRKFVHDTNHMTVEGAADNRTQAAQKLQQGFDPEQFCRYQILNRNLTGNRTKTIQRMTEEDLNERVRRMKEEPAMKMLQEHLPAQQLTAEQLNACWDVCKDAVKEIKAAEKLSLEMLNAKRRQNRNAEHTSHVPGFDDAIATEKNAKLDEIVRKEKAKRTAEFEKALNDENTASDYQRFCNAMKPEGEIANKSHIPMDPTAFGMLAALMMLQSNSSVDDIMHPADADKETARNAVANMLSAEDADEQIRTLFMNSAETLQKKMQEITRRTGFTDLSFTGADARRAGFLASLAGNIQQESPRVNTEYSPEAEAALNYCVCYNGMLPKTDFREDMKQILTGDDVNNKKDRIVSLFSSVISAKEFAGKHSKDLQKHIKRPAEQNENRKILKDLASHYQQETLEECNRSETLTAFAQELASSKEDFELLAPFIQDGSISELFKIEYREIVQRNPQEVLAGPHLTHVPDIDECRTWAQKRYIQQEQQFGKFLSAKKNEYKNCTNPFIQDDLKEGRKALAEMYNHLIPAHGVTSAEKQNHASRLMKQYLKTEWVKNYPGYTLDRKQLTDLFDEKVIIDPEVRSWLDHPDSSDLYRFTAGGECTRMINKLQKQLLNQKKLDPQKTAPVQQMLQ